jgi:signal transduction histidine kinase
MKGWPAFGALGIGTKLTLAFGVLAGVTFLVVALAWVAGQRVTRDIDLSELVRRPASLASTRAQADLLRMQLHVRGYLVLSDPADIEQYRTARRSFEGDLVALQSMSDQWPEAEDARAVRSLVDGYRQWADLPQQLFDLHDNPLKNRPALRLARVEVQARLVRILDAVDRIVELQKSRDRDAPSRELLLAYLLEFQTSFDAMATNLMAFGASGEVNFKLTYGPQLATNAAAWRSLAARRALFSADQRQLLEVIARNRAEVADLALEIVGVVNGEHAYEDLYLYRTKVAPQADVLLQRLADLTTRQQAQLGSSLARARQSVASVRLVAAVAGLFAVVVALALAYGFRRSVVSPLQRLTGVAERVTAGDLAARAQIHSSDEIGVLAKSINTMTERLSETIRHLEAIYEEARHAKAAAEVANRAKSSFLANMSHELRTPLNAVLGYAQILQEEPGLGAFQFERLEKIRRGGEHLLSLINDVLDLSRIEAGKVELQLQPLRLSELLRAVEGSIGAAAQRKGLSFSCEFAPDLPIAVRVDARRLERVLLNLLANAVKFTEQGEVILRVRRLEVADAKQARLRFEIVDSGIGIASAQMPTLFKPFEQASIAQRQYGGTGLGLAISQQIVAMMGGCIQVESQLGQGSVFRFDIDLELAASGEAPAAARGGQGPPTIWRRILVVDCAGARRAALAESLAACGFELMLADDSASALEQAGTQRPDLILAAVATTGGEDGREAIRRLRRDTRVRDVPVIALSPSSEYVDGVNRDADAVLSEPFDLASLAVTIGELQQRQRQDITASHAGSGVAGPAHTLVVPAAEELAHLYELARIGNMRSIGERADYLVRLDQAYQPFACRLRELAQRFQSRAITDWISELRSDGADGANAPVRDPTIGL